MAVKPLLEHLEEAEKMLQEASFAYRKFPSTLRAIRMVTAMERVREMNDFLQSIVVDIAEEGEPDRPRKSIRRRRGG